MITAAIILSSMIKIHAHTPYPSGVKLEVIGLVKGKRRLIKSDILPYDQAMADLLLKIRRLGASVAYLDPSTYLY